MSGSTFHSSKFFHPNNLITSRSREVTRGYTSFLVFFFLLTFAAPQAESATITVDAGATDQAVAGVDGNCSLREAISAINNSAVTTDCVEPGQVDTSVNPFGALDEIIISAETITVTLTAIEDANAGGDFDITKAVIITGAGAGSTIIDGGGVGIGDRVFHVTVINVPVTFDGVTIQNGSTTGSGGGIFARGAVTLTNSTVSGNTAINNGGFFTWGSVTLTNSTVSGNTAGTNYGGFFTWGSVTLTNATVSGNIAGLEVGGIWAGGAVTLTNSTVSGNTAGTNYGGIFTWGSVTLTDSTVSGNTAGWNYGGIWAGVGLTATNSTVSNNTATTGSYGGIYSSGGAVTLTNSTVSNNTATAGSYGGIWAGVGLTATNSTIYDNSDAGTAGGVYVNGGTASITNSIIANNTGGPDCAGGATYTSGGYNIDSDNTCNLVGTGDQINTDPLVSALANNGGTTWTHALTAASPAIDSGSCVKTTDQRGETRPQDGDGDTLTRCDIGAFELVVNGSNTLTVTVSGTGTVDDGIAISNITACAGTCADTYDPTATVTLTATPTAGNYFVGWSGDCTGTGTCNVTLSAAKNVTATFAANTLGVTVTGAGTVTSNINGVGAGISCDPTCSDDYTVGDNVTLTAAATAGNYFTGWGGDCAFAGTASTCLITLNTGATVTAAFGVQDSLTVIIIGSGTVTSDIGSINCFDNTGTCADTYTPGDTVTLTATPSASYTFTSWSGACTGTGTCVITMAGATSATATFELNGCTDATATNYNAAAVVDDGSCTYSSSSSSSNSPPSNTGGGTDWLNYPEDALTNVPTGTVFKWTKLTDADGDPITYTLYLCHEADWDSFANDCTNWIAITGITASAGGALRQAQGDRVMTANAGAAAGAAALFGIALFGAMRTRRGRAYMMALMMIASAGMIASCATDSSDDSADDSATTYTLCDDEAGLVCEDISTSYTLDANTEYHWYVNAADGNGGTTNSDTRSFTTGN